MPAWFLWSSMIQRLTDSTTQRWHNTHLLFYTSTLMRFNKKRSSCILFTEYRHPRRYKRFLQQIHKREVWKFLGFLLLLCLSPFNSSATETQPYVRHSGRSPAQLSSLLQKSLTPPSCYPKISPFSKPAFLIFFSEPRSFLREASSPKSPCLPLYAPKPPFHNCSTDPNHNIRTAIQPPFNSSHPANLPAKTPHTNQVVLPMQM